MNIRHRPNLDATALIAVLALMLAPVLAKDPPPTAQVLKLVDAMADGADLEETLATLEKEGLTPEDLRAILAAPREYAVAEPGRKVIEIADGYGGKTDAVLLVPRSYKPERAAAGLIICLHGLGGEGEQVVDLYADLVEKEGWLMVCPTAQPLPADKPHPDTAVLKNFPQLAQTHWWSYWSQSFPLTILRQLGRTYRIDRDKVVLSGYSMGGFGTWNIGMRFPDRFAALAPLAGGISGAEYLGSDDTTMRALLCNIVELPIFFAHGDADTTVPVRFAQRTDEQLRELGARQATYLEIPGGQHMLDLSPGGKLKRDLDKFVIAGLRKPNPKIIVHAAHDIDHGACHWITIDELAATIGKVTARMASQGKFEVETSGVKALSIRVNEELVKLSKPITIKVDGKVAFKGKVEPSLRDLLESWRLCEDPALLYDARVKIALEREGK